MISTLERGKNHPDKILNYTQVNLAELAERLDASVLEPQSSTIWSRTHKTTDLIFPGRDIHLGRNGNGVPTLTFRDPLTELMRSARVDEVIIPGDDQRYASFVEKNFWVGDLISQTMITINCKVKNNFLKY
jgi:hypothetical protein